ncbi:LuxR C-terminal-related transcriptional regulator [Nocardioides limicola]|uniref:LuxR C-terminal-related transcriptional regulator n=1 Tax=Nocardioides limicola TaxID=2803368 RepID=UPI00193AE8CC|nr:LuxR C-terminal-related transcriptional regulator [Nocardioides sp. DJM-14]
MSAYSKERAIERIARLARSGLDVDSFFQAAGEVIMSAVPACESPCWTTFDPASLLITSSHQEGWPELPPEALAAEYLEDDPLKSLDVARSERGIQTLQEATGGDPNRSRAYREYMAPAGIRHSVEAALRTRTGQTWGTVGLARQVGQPDFDTDDLEFLLAIAVHLANGVRQGLLVGEATDPEGPNSPGLVVLDADWGVESLSPDVDRWLAELPGEWKKHGALPPSVVAVAASALRTARDENAPGEVAIARVLSRAGRWIVLHGAALVAAGGRRAAVIVEPAHPARIAPLLMAAYGLTEREQEVTRLILRGEGTAQIAAALVVSPHTVQQHLKSVFDKTGVRSRRELVSKIFFAHYEPRVRDNEHRVITDRPIRGGPFPWPGLVGDGRR